MRPNLCASLEILTISSCGKMTPPECQKDAQACDQILWWVADTGAKGGGRGGPTEGVLQ